MSETLIVKNFGPIKYVKLDIKKINVLIGEQGTGKSALVRLLNHFTSKNFLFGNEIDREGNFEDNFFNNADSEIEYSSQDYNIKYIGVGNGFKVHFIGRNKMQLERLSSLYKKFIEDHDLKYQDEYYSLSDWYDENILTHSYVPAERIAITTMDSWNSNRDYLDQYIVKFFGNFHTAREKNSEFKIPHLNNVIYKREDEQDKIIFNGETLLLRSASSGFQSSIPLSVFIEYFTSINKKIRFIIEEPELNLFPGTQYELIKYLIEKTSAKKNGLFLATHSPYILSAINNLLFANEIGKIDAKKAVKIIPKKYWLDYKDISAYMLINGTARNILDNSVKQLQAEKIDSVSRKINQQYDQMLDIKYPPNKQMRNRIEKCQQFRDNRSTPSVSEKGKTFQIDNKKAKMEIGCIKIDDCVFNRTDGIKCDYLFDINSLKKIFLIELKGSDVIQATNQIYTTLTKIKSLYPGWIYEARIVLGNTVPDITNRREYDGLSKIIKQSGGKIIIKHQYLYKEPHKVWNTIT